MIPDMITNGVLLITDGTDSVDLLNDFQLFEWTPATAAAKGGGTWSSSPFIPGRQLVLHEYDNILDTFELKARGGGSTDQLIRNTQNLRRLLEKAIAYWTSDWQSEPVWIETRGICETNTRYAVIHDYRTPNDDNPFSSPVATNQVFDEFTLFLEHGLWQDSAPGTGTATEIGAYSTYDGVNFGNVDDTGVFTPTSADEVYIANKYNQANLTDIYYYDASIGAYTGNLIGAALPTALFPNPVQIGDIVYFGIDTAVANSGPFCSLVFDINQKLLATLLWEYWNGAIWTALTVQDNTDTAGMMTGNALDTVGVNSVHWDQPTNWAATTVPAGVGAPAATAFWVRLRVSAIIGAPLPPTQRNRNIYTVTWPYTDIDETELGGDLPALLGLELENSMDNAAHAVWVTTVGRVTVGARSLARGANFSAYINFSDEQNIAGITVTPSGAFPFVNAVVSPTGRAIYGFAPGAIATIAALNLDNTICDDYIGTYHLFVRATCDAVVNPGDCGLRVRLQYPLGITIHTSNIVLNPNDGDCVFDMGIIEIPSHGNGLQIDTIRIVFDLVGYAGGGVTGMTFIDAVFMPTDEWVIDSLRPSYELLNYSDNIGYDNANNRTILDVSSIANPKISIRSLVRQKAAGYVNAAYVAVSSGEFAANVNTDVRLWFFTQSGTLELTTSWRSDFEQASRIMLDKTQRYLAMRGDR